MRKTLLLFTTMALALLLAAGTAWAALPAPTVVSTGTDPSTTFYLLQGNFTGSTTKNPPRFCSTPPGTACPTPIPATVSYNADTKTATLNPTPTLVAGTTYTAVVEGTADGDFVAVKDTGGTPMASDYIFHFTTGSDGGGPGLP